MAPSPIGRPDGPGLKPIALRVLITAGVEAAVGIIDMIRDSRVDTEGKIDEVAAVKSKTPKKKFLGINKLKKLKFWKKH
jgi:hypothetical protein